MMLELSSMTKLPVLIESTDAEKTRALLRAYPGRAAVKGVKPNAFGALYTDK